jgi:hypothetical protein
MANLQDELKRMLKIQKEIIKNDTSEKRLIQNSTAESKVTAKNDPIKIYAGPKTIRCRVCGLDILSHLINQHNNEVHTDLQIGKRKTNQFNNTFNSTDNIISVRETVIDGQQVTITRKKAAKEENNSISSKEKTINNPPKDNKTSELKFVSSYQLSTNKDFKMPDEWVTNPYYFNDGLRKVDITIGLDFGTSYTKACVRFADKHYIVDWAGISNFPDKHTLPSELSIFKDGSSHIGRSMDAVSVVSSLKIPLLEKHRFDQTDNNAIDYIALVLNYVRSWWFYHHANLFKGNSLDWIVNIGCPSEQFEDEYWISKYKNIVNKAWAKSFIDSKPIQLHDDNIAIVPEFVAEIASYTKSAQRQEDLHLLIDIGGGTLDIVTFNIHRDENDEEIFPIFDSEVINLGTHYLMSERIHKSRISDGEFISTAVLSTEEFSNQFHQEYEKIRDIDSLFMEEVKKKILKVLNLTKKNRYYSSPNWHKGIRTFICGGGSNSSIYNDAIDGVIPTYNLSKINLPLPSNIDAIGLNKKDFHRVSVAYGLSFDVMNLGYIKRKQDVEDAPKEKLKLRASNTDFIDD